LAKLYIILSCRPWRLGDADFVLDASLPLDPRKTVFVGGVPRPLKAGKLKCYPQTKMVQCKIVNSYFQLNWL